MSFNERYSKEIKPVNSKGNQSWIFTGRTEAEAPILWLPNARNWLIGKDPDAGKDWGQEKKGTTKVEMVGWHHGLNGCEFEQTLGESGGQGNLAHCSLWGHKELDMTEELKTNLNLPCLLVSVSLKASLRNVFLFHHWQSGKLAFHSAWHLRHTRLGPRYLPATHEPHVKPWICDRIFLILFLICKMRMMTATCLRIAVRIKRDEVSFIRHFSEHKHLFNVSCGISFISLQCP